MTGAVPAARWLAEAVALATANVAQGGGPFGALVVRGEEVVGRGVNRVTLDLDPTAHAEVVAIRAACAAVGDFRLAGCVLVSSCEPCPLCLSAALWARLDAVVYAADRDDAAEAGFDDREFYDVLARPRETWPVAVTHHRTGTESAPFTAWRTRPGRVDY
ncbi:nucleoside deaminase [Actinokineospora sp. NBRC 105648]|uniref:nucleoside deaminase n=1 Tax=Actinokineospora sp. NBRC 105648 TaxID=3032206 RepID=UPI0024A035B9|nr:nucleoside deaminase [Actinokineospora sp. NBRC 105648]GLZ40244.1 tRNA-specific adenosine deaminase [Actinokineospora sp. NBRC 105648]